MVVAVVVVVVVVVLVVLVVVLVVVVVVVAAVVADADARGTHAWACAKHAAGHHAIQNIHKHTAASRAQF